MFDAQTVKAWRSGYLLFDVNGFLFLTYARADNYFRNRPPLGTAVFRGFHWRWGWKAFFLRDRDYAPVTQEPTFL